MHAIVAHQNSISLPKMVRSPSLSTGINPKGCQEGKRKTKEEETRVRTATVVCLITNSTAGLQTTGNKKLSLVWMMN
jgi:hypothetical protein